MKFFGRKKKAPVEGPARVEAGRTDQLVHKLELVSQLLEVAESETQQSAEKLDRALTYLENVVSDD